jgi:hypothetical protein
MACTILLWTDSSETTLAAVLREAAAKHRAPASCGGPMLINGSHDNTFHGDEFAGWPPCGHRDACLDFHDHLHRRPDVPPGGPRR